MPPFAKELAPSDARGTHEQDQHGELYANPALQRSVDDKAGPNGTVMPGLGGLQRHARHPPRLGCRKGLGGLRHSVRH